MKGEKDMKHRSITRGAITAAISMVLLAGASATVTVHRHWTARAYAEEVRTEMVRSYRDSRRWRAEIQERELTDSGQYRTVRHQVDVDGADRYRMETTETSESGEEVSSVTSRVGTTVYSTTRTGKAGLHVLELRNVPPSLGAVTDNVLGQSVRELARPGKMRFMKREAMRGRTGLKLAVDSGHLVWVDSESAVPLKEQLLSGDVVTHEMDVLSFESGVTHSALIPERSGAISWSVEDLGFRECAVHNAPVQKLGFVPRTLDVPKSWKLVSSGYTQAPYSEGGAEPATVSALYDTPDGAVLFTQMNAAFVPELSAENTDGTEGPATTRACGRTVRYFEDEWRTHATTRVGNVFVSVEALLPADMTLEMMGYVR